MKLNILKKTVEELSSNPKQTFLMDLVGAIITAFFTGIVLVYFHDCFGMPKKALYVLSSLACFFIEKIILLCVICIEMKTINKI